MSKCFGQVIVAGVVGLLVSGSALCQTKVVKPEPYDGILDNPGMGVYYFATRDEKDMPKDAPYFDLVQIGYAREDWASLQNEGDGEGQYRFKERLEPLFDLWVKKLNKRISFRFMSSNMHSRRKYVSPKWVFDAGVPSVTHKGLYVPEQIDPVFWDGKYLQIQERFIAQLGEYLDGREGLEFIDIGGIGEWGEMHLSRWTSKQLADSGYSDEKYVAAYRRMIDAYVKAFPRTRVFLNVGDFASINDYAAIKGVHFRQDGLTPSGASYDVGRKLYREYAWRGVLCNYEMHSGYGEMKEKGWDMIKTFEVGLADPVSYWHINLLNYGQMRNPPDDYKRAMSMLSAKLGYHLSISELEISEKIGVGRGVPGRLAIRSKWTNRGLAAPVESYAVEWALVDSGGKAAVKLLQYPKTPTTKWWAGEEIAVDAMLRIPAELPEGQYTFSAKMLLPERPGQVIELAMKGREADGTYRLAQLPAERGQKAQGKLWEMDPGKGIQGWGAAEGMKVSRAEEGHTAPGSLQVSGEQPGKAWSYASYELGERLRPGGRYQVSCWMKVTEWSDEKQPPYLKVQLNAKDGKWLDNVSSDKYDLSRRGEWQRLTIVCEVPLNAAKTSIAIERGSFERAIGGTMFLDDFEAVVIEAP